MEVVGLKQADKVHHFEIEERNGVIRFVNECCVLDTEHQAKTSDLYEGYVQWCQADERLLVGKNKFISLLREEVARSGHVISAIKTNAYRGWKGISLASTPSNLLGLKMLSPEIDSAAGVRRFINDMCLTGPKKYCRAINLYKNYIDWVESNFPNDLDLIFGIHMFYSKVRVALSIQGNDFDYSTYKGRAWFEGIELK
jgi:phage/plasmid-associated DNA primase